MGLLADIYSGSDSLKRKVKGLLADPLGTIEQKINQFGEDQQAAINNAQDATGFGGNRSVLMSPQQKQQASKALGDYAGSMGLAGLTVWHGSPHKFDKFDSGKIGTGEGAQAYGHGLYLAESPDVAKMYKDALSRYDVPDTGPVQFAHNILQSNKYAGRTEEMLRKSHPNLGDAEISATIQQAKDAIAKGKTGALYKVNLPDDQIAKMLDWDKPLHRQAPEIRKALRGVVDDNLGQGAYSGIIRSRPDFKNLQNDILENLDQSQISEQLRNKGLTGIRYLDGGSRGAGSGSSNFVVFPGNEGLLNILERNGQPMNGLLAK